jgi:hypothetical protein
VAGPVQILPLLDAIAVDTALADGLPCEALSALMQRCAAVMTALAKAHSSQATVQHAAPIDRTLSADEIAEALGRNRRWVFRNACKLPFVRRISRKCVVGSESGLRRWREAQKA